METADKGGVGLVSATRKCEGVESMNQVKIWDSIDVTSLLSLLRRRLWRIRIL
jgi:hypothetical protein